MKTVNLIEHLRDLLRSAEHAGEENIIEFPLNLNLKLYSETGELKEERDYHNVICTAGKNLVLAASAGKLPAVFSYIGIGTGTTAAAAADTALQTEVGTRVNGTVSNPTASQLQIQGTFAAGNGTATISEAGLLDAAIAGDLLAHQVFVGVAKAAGDSLTVTWTLS